MDSNRSFFRSRLKGKVCLMLASASSQHFARACYLKRPRLASSFSFPWAVARSWLSLSRVFFLLRSFCNEALSRQQQPGDGGSILKSGARHLFRVHDAGLDQVFVLVG